MTAHITGTGATNVIGSTRIDASGCRRPLVGEGGICILHRLLSRLFCLLLQPGYLRLRSYAYKRGCMCIPMLTSMVTYISGRYIFACMSADTKLLTFPTSMSAVLTVGMTGRACFFLSWAFSWRWSLLILSPPPPPLVETATTEGERGEEAMEDDDDKDNDTDDDVSEEGDVVDDRVGDRDANDDDGPMKDEEEEDEEPFFDRGTSKAPIFADDDNEEEAAPAASDTVAADVSSLSSSTRRS